METINIRAERVKQAIITEAKKQVAEDKAKYDVFADSGFQKSLGDFTKDAYTDGAQDQLQADLKAFESFVDKYHLLNSYGHANAFRKFMEDMKGQMS